MYYLARSHSVPCPADAPYTATANEKQQWDYHQAKHKAALRDVVGLVDQNPPGSIDLPLQRVQRKTRQFAEKSRKAEIGRENQKLVKRLRQVAEGAWPGAGGQPTLNGAGHQGLHTAHPPRPAAAGTAASAQAMTWSTMSTGSGSTTRIPPPAAPGSLHEVRRRKEQRAIERDNAHLVRRILSTGAVIDNQTVENSFQRHCQNSLMLRRFSGDASSPPMKPRALRPIQRATSCPRLPPERLAGLMLPEDLMWCEPSGESCLALSAQAELDDSQVQPISTQQVKRIARDIFRSLDLDGDKLVKKEDWTPHPALEAAIMDTFSVDPDKGLGQVDFIRVLVEATEEQNDGGVFIKDLARALGVTFKEKPTRIATPPRVPLPLPASGSRRKAAASRGIRSRSSGGTGLCQATSSGDHKGQAGPPTSQSETQGQRGSLREERPASRSRSQTPSPRSRSRTPSPRSRSRSRTPSPRSRSRTPSPRSRSRSP